MNKFMTPGKVRNVNGSIVAPINAGLRIILNLVSQSGKFDQLVDLKLSKRWSKVKEDYRGWYVNQQNFKLGSIMNTLVASDIWVCSLLVKDKDGVASEDGLDRAMKRLGEISVYEKASVHIPSSLVEEFPKINELATKYLIEQGINCYFYEEQIK